MQSKYNAILHGGKWLVNYKFSETVVNQGSYRGGGGRGGVGKGLRNYDFIHVIIALNMV